MEIILIVNNLIVKCKNNLLLYWIKKQDPTKYCYKYKIEFKSKKMGKNHKNTKHNKVCVTVFPTLHQGRIQKKKYNVIMKHIL